MSALQSDAEAAALRQRADRAEQRVRQQVDELSELRSSRTVAHHIERERCNSRSDATQNSNFNDLR